MHAIQSTPTGSALADLIISYMDLKPEEKQEILELIDLPQRLTRVSELLARRIEVLKISRDISQQTREKLDERQREFVLREQLKTIQKELGEADDQAAEVQEIAEAIAKAGMPEEVEKHARKELKRLERMPEASGEYSMLRTYLDWLTELPWSVASTDSLDIPAARRCWTRTTWAWTRSSGASSSTWPCASSAPRARARSCASSARRAWARPRSARASPAPWAASSCACRWAACTTRRRSAATAAPTSARCRATSSRPSARAARAIR